MLDMRTVLRMTDRETDLLTVTETVERLAEMGIIVTPQTVQRWCKRGRIPAYRLPGGHYRIAVGDVDALLANTVSAA